HAKAKGYQVHSTILMDATTEKTIGLIAQNRWCRNSSAYGKSTQRNTRAYKDKESYKWEKNTHELEQRLSEKLADTISVCDRDAGI
ncbi:TPA: IS4 family transposase, partial [Legionella pneumophila]|nr:IS4 family transposase [Legionella pneumophila]